MQSNGRLVQLCFGSTDRSQKQALMPQLWQLRESKLRELPVSGALQDKSLPLRSIQSPILQQQAKLSWDTSCDALII